MLLSHKIFLIIAGLLLLLGIATTPSVTGAVIPEPTVTLTSVPIPTPTQTPTPDPFENITIPTATPLGG